MISQRNLSLLSNRLAREGGRRILEKTLENASFFSDDSTP